MVDRFIIIIAETDGRCIDHKIGLSDLRDVIALFRLNYERYLEADKSRTSP